MVLSIAKIDGKKYWQYFFNARIIKYWQYLSNTQKSIGNSITAIQYCNINNPGELPSIVNIRHGNQTKLLESFTTEAHEMKQDKNTLKNVWTLEPVPSPIFIVKDPISRSCVRISGLFEPPS